MALSGGVPLFIHIPSCLGSPVRRFKGVNAAFESTKKSYPKLLTSQIPISDTKTGTVKSPPYLHVVTSTHIPGHCLGGGNSGAPFIMPILSPLHFGVSHPARLQIGFSLHVSFCPALHKPDFELVSISLWRCLETDTIFSVYFQSLAWCKPTRSFLSTSPVNRDE